MSQSMNEIHPYLELLEEHNLTKEDLEAFTNSKGWQMLNSYISNKFLENVEIVTSDGFQVSNSKKLEAASKMGILRELSNLPIDILKRLREVENENLY